MNRNVMLPISPRVVNYHNNGTARDSYVSYDCGGYHQLKQQTPNTSHVQNKQFSLNKIHTKSANSLTPLMKHYINDGKGRDVYISCNHGGSSRLYSDRYINPVEHFQHNLRSYDQIVDRSQVLNDSFTKSQLLMSKKDSLKNLKIAQSQRNLLDRLYNQKLPSIRKNKD